MFFADWFLGTGGISSVESEKYKVESRLKPSTFPRASILFGKMDQTPPAFHLSPSTCLVHVHERPPAFVNVTVIVNDQPPPRPLR